MKSDRMWQHLNAYEFAEVINAVRDIQQLLQQTELPLAELRAKTQKFNEVFDRYRITKETIERLVAGRQGAETAQDDEAFRNELAKVLWEHSIAEEGPRVQGKDWAPWPDDAIRQPYCKSTFRRADAIIKFLIGRQG